MAKSTQSKNSSRSSSIKKATDESPLTAFLSKKQEKVGTQNPQEHSISAVNDAKKKKKQTSHKDKPRSKRGQKRARKEANEDLEEERLTALLFGSGGIESAGNEDPFGSLTTEEKSSKLKNVVEESTAEDDVNFGFEIDRTGQGSEEEEEEEEEAAVVESTTKEQNEKDYSSDDDDDDDGEEEEDAPAWEDPDDVTTKLVDASSRLKKLRTTRQETTALSSQELEERLRKRYEESTQATARTDWATSLTTKSKHTRFAGSDEEEDEEDGAVDLFSTSTALLSTSRNRLPPNRLDIIRCPDANLVDPNKAVVRAVNFHPGSDPDRPLMLTAGLDKTLRFFQVGEEKSEKIHGIHCKYDDQM